MSDTPRMDPQCLAGSFEKPGCAAERFKARITDLERELAALKVERDEFENELVLLKADARFQLTEKMLEAAAKKQHELQAKLAACEKDAERYRWLRQWHWINTDEVVKNYPMWGPGTAYPTWQEATDAAIDAALKENKHE